MLGVSTGDICVLGVSTGVLLGYLLVIYLCVGGIYLLVIYLCVGGIYW